MEDVPDNHIDIMVSVDFFTVPTIRFQILYVAVVPAHDRRLIAHFAVTTHPTADWTAQQLREAFPWESAPGYLLGASAIACSVEHFIAQVRRWALNRCIRLRGSYGSVHASNRHHPPRVPRSHDRVQRTTSVPEHLGSFVEYHHRSRTHLALEKDSPEPRPIQLPEAGRIIAIPQVGELHHRYEPRVAA